MILKELRQVSNVCCIMVTSQNTDMDEMLSLSYGADDYITKPYHPTLLLLRIEAIFRRLSGKQKETMYRDVHIYVDKSTLEKMDKPYFYLKMRWEFLITYLNIKELLLVVMI